MLDAQKPSSPLNENITILLRRTSSSNTHFGRISKTTALDKYLGSFGCGKWTKSGPRISQKAK